MNEEVRLYVPVVAHRLYGTKFLRQEALPQTSLRTPNPLQVDINAFRRDEIGEGLFTAEIDTAHGTQISPLNRIRAMFIPDESDFDFYTLTEGLTVNRVWESANIHFYLIATIDHMIASHDADYMRCGDFGQRFARRFNRPGVLNLYFVRNIISANGHAYMYRPTSNVDMSHALVSDYDEELWGDIYNWQLRVMVVAHEFGHFLGLTHVVERDNTMRNGGVSIPSMFLEKPQWRIAQHRARYFRSPLYLREHSSIPHLGVELDNAELPIW